MNPSLRTPLLLLSESTFFKGLSEASRRALAALATTRDVEKREVLFHEGDEGHSVYLLRRGRVQLLKAAPDGREVAIRTLQPGETFGEVVLFERDRYPVTAVALTDCALILLPKRAVQRLLAQEDFRNDFMATLMRRLRYLTERIVQLTSEDVESRLLAFLREQFGESGEAAVTLSKKSIAAAVGTTPETVSRLIRALQRRRVFSWKGDTLRWLAAPPAGDRPPGCP